MTDSIWKPKAPYVAPDATLDPDVWYPKSDKPNTSDDGEETPPMRLEDVLYGSSDSVHKMWNRHLEPETHRLGDVVGLTSEQRTQFQSAAQEAFHDAHFEHDVGKQLYAQMVENQIHPPSKETLTQWDAEIRRRFRVNWGSGAEADQRFRDAWQFIENRPELKKGLRGFPPDLMEWLAKNRDRLKLTPPRKKK